MTHPTFPPISRAMTHGGNRETFLRHMMWVLFSTYHLPSNVFQRAPNSTGRRVSPSPGPSRRPYDSYVPPPRPDTFRDGGPNNYRPNVYRPEHSSKYYSRSPSPDPYIPPSRVSDPDIWDRAPTWRPPFADAPNIWPERKNVPPSPTTSARSRNSRDDSSSRLFEPSDSWKQTHHDRPSRLDQ